MDKYLPEKYVVNISGRNNEYSILAICDSITEVKEVISQHVADPLDEDSFTGLFYIYKLISMDEGEVSSVSHYSTDIASNTH